MSAFTELAQEVYDDYAAEEFAFPAILHTITQGEPDWSTGGLSTTTVDNQAYIIFLAPTKKEATPVSFSMEEGDKIVSFAGNGVEPTTAHTITIDAHTYTIVRAIDEAVGARALFTLQIR